MKSPGVFHRDQGGLYDSLATRSAAETAHPDPTAYFAAVRNTRVWEATGRPDFALAVSFCRRLLEV